MGNFWFAFIVILGLLGMTGAIILVLDLLLWKSKRPDVRAIHKYTAIPSDEEAEAELDRQALERGDRPPRRTCEGYTGLTGYTGRSRP